MKNSFAVAALLLASPAFAAPLIGMDDYAQPNTLVDVGNGRKMNLFCKGSGSPTVVFDSGSGLAGWDWLRVQPVIASKTRACVYDRAGLGFSDASTRPGTSANAMDDLHRLLSSAGIKPPYVLVGHSYGGMTVQLYAYTYPKEVAGLVLVDAGHEDETSRLNRVTGGLYEKLMGEYAEISKACTVAAQRGGLVAGGQLYRQCVGEPPAMFRGNLAKAYLGRRTSVAYWEANQSEEEHETISADQLRAARKSFGNLPLAYLTRGNSPFQPPGKPQSELNKAAEREVKAMHDETAKLSTRGSNRLVPGAGHSIHVDKPRAVIDATLDVLKQARSAPQAP
jgi:pimeloyl-ACP methyl ester carboxylesterase